MTEMKEAMRFEHTKLFALLPENAKRTENSGDLKQRV
jgi:hypothetical protein